MDKKLLIISLLLAGLFLAGEAKAQSTELALAFSTPPRGFVYTVSSFKLNYKDQITTIDNKTLADWQGLSPWQAGSPLSPAKADIQSDLSAFFGLPSPASAAQPTTLHYRMDKIYGFITGLASSTNQTVVNPALTIENNQSTASTSLGMTPRVINFTMPQNGLELDVYKTTLAVAAALERNLDNAGLIVYETTPEKKLSDTNSLGINELVAQGLSNFKGSPKNRRFNIAVGVEKMKGILVAPGATFSFDDNLGPVDGEHGFLPELVIKKEGTIPEFGGGLCQVSTTTFRAAMNAGVPITERRNHAYAVQYYSPQGTDATIYPGSADLKFVNDTPAYILIWPYLKDKDNLVFDFYGTKDAREVTLDKPVVYDRQSDGSMKATWTRHVLNNGETVSKTFKSVYQSPALFHKTETFVSATGTQQSILKIPPAKIQ